MALNEILDWTEHSTRKQQYTFFSSAGGIFSSVYHMLYHPSSDLDGVACGTSW